MSKDRARLEILSELLSFPSIRDKDWTSCFLEERAQVGDLVALNSAPPSKWYVSWLREIDPNNGWPRYLLESIDDGSLCWWGNVGLSYFNRKTVEGRYTWKWDDKQFEFRDRWWKVAYKKNDAYMVLPVYPLFNDNGSVLLDVRVRFSLSDYHNPRTFENWKKVMIKQMDEYFKECLLGYELSLKEKTHG
jgi:hypothetical protein